MKHLTLSNNNSRIQLLQMFFFQISKNPITAEGACLAIRLIKEHPDCGLQLLEMKVKLCNTLYFFLLLYKQAILYQGMLLFILIFTLR